MSPLAQPRASLAAVLLAVFAAQSFGESLHERIDRAVAAGEENFAKRAAAPASDAEFHAAVRSQIQRGEQACRNCDITDSRIGDTSAEPHFFCIGGHEREERKRLFPA